MPGRRVVGRDDHRLVARPGVRHDVLERHLAQRRQLVARPVERVRERTAGRRGLLAVGVEPAVVALPGLGVVERRQLGEVSRAEAVEDDALGRRVVRTRRRVPRHRLLDQVLAVQDLEALLVDGPLRHERALGAVLAHDARIGTQLVVHEHREGAVAVVERAEAVGNADHAVGRPVGLVVDRVADRQQRRHADVLLRRHDVRRLRAAGTGGDRLDLAVGLAGPCRRGRGQRSQRQRRRHELLPVLHGAPSPSGSWRPHHEPRRPGTRTTTKSL